MWMHRCFYADLENLKAKFWHNYDYVCNVDKTNVVYLMSATVSCIFLDELYNMKVAAIS